MSNLTIRYLLPLPLSSLSSMFEESKTQLMFFISQLNQRDRTNRRCTQRFIARNCLTLFQGLGRQVQIPSHRPLELQKLLSTQEPRISLLLPLRSLNSALKPTQIMEDNPLYKNQLILKLESEKSTPVMSLSRFATPWTTSHSPDFSEPEYQSRQPSLLSRSLYNRNRNRVSCITDGFFTN